MQNTIATVLKSNVGKLVQASPLFSLLIDESTAVSNHENVVVNMKLLNDVKPEFHFFGKTSMFGMARPKLLLLLTC